MTNTMCNIPTQAGTAVSGISMRASGGYAFRGAFAAKPVIGGRERLGADVATRTQGTSVWSPPT